MPEADLEVRRQPLEVLGQQLHREVVGRLHRRPDRAVGLVRTDEHATTLLAQVDLAGVVGGVHDLLLPACELRDILGQQIVVLHRQHRQLDADHVADLACPQTRAVHHVLGVHRALVGHDVPGAVAALPERQHAGEAFHRGAERSSRLDVGVGGARGIAMPTVRAPQRADEMAGIDQGIEVARLLERDHLGFHSQVARP